MNEIKQFKLSNGDEIVCDVIEWPDVDGDSPDIVVRNCFKIVVAGVKSSGDNIRYYQFRPWMVHQDEPDMFQVINGNHIIVQPIIGRCHMITYSTLCDFTFVVRKL